MELVKQWISLLADRHDFVKMGGQYINGLMLTGEPGTGKTMLAKAMAGEAGIAFMSVEGSGFRGMFWGMDTLKMMGFVRKARKLAREYGACIAYIDEIDAVAMSRSGVQGSNQNMATGGMMGGMMMNGALTRLLYEMDGIAEPGRVEKWKAKIAAMRGKPPPQRDWHVLFMGSTNRPDVLDPALLRPGRLIRSFKSTARTGLVGDRSSRVTWRRSDTIPSRSISKRSWRIPRARRPPRLWPPLPRIPCAMPSLRAATASSKLMSIISPGADRRNGQPDSRNGPAADASGRIP